jgi:hypothetical protein
MRRGLVAVKDLGPVLTGEVGEHRTLGGFYPVRHREKVESGGRTIMNAQEAAPPTTSVTTGEAQPEFSQRYSRGELEEMDSRELLDGYAE